MIPKTIHCIWLGKGSLPCRSSAFIKLWKRKLPDYTIKIWNEDNLPITEECSRNKYLRECYKRKLYAFVSDYFRLWILFNYGGIYLDTDVEILNSFDSPICAFPASNPIKPLLVSSESKLLRISTSVSK